MRVRHTLLIAGLLAVSVSTGSAQAGDRLTYRWVDAEGNLQLSDSLPGREASRGYEVIDPSTGRVLREVAPRKTEAQRAREQAEREAAEDRRRQASQQANRDRILRSLYGDEADIERAHDDRLDRLDDRIRQMEVSIDRMETAIAAGQDNFQGDEAYRSDLETLRRSLAETRAERREEVKRYQSDLQRFRELTSGE
ncbi:MAG: DUF4124 domain-containing protein [Halothiobacillaceae bacterium]|nr:DUF4124 domain-containing protein [Halothiobacillaceae bacterium]